MKNIKKIDISNSINKKKGFSNLVSKKLTDDLIFTLISLIKKKNLLLKNFGLFKTLNKKERIGRNPKTKNIYIISQRKSLSFRPSKSLVKKVNH